MEGVNIKYPSLYIYFKQALLVYLILSLIACTPYIRFDREAERLGYLRKTVPGNEFSHIVYVSGDIKKAKEVHVYLDGDGTPWVNPRRIAIDPTPRNPLVLRLMSLDTVPSLYLGRPCYHGLSDTEACNPSLWTHQRYSPRIIDSMVSALEQLFIDSQVDRIVLVGYSGGGTLAMLLTDQVSNVRGLITIAANLDIDLWTRHHGYSALVDSINPALQAPLNPKVFQLHLSGQKDSNVPPSLIRSVVDRQQNAELLLLEEQDHSCCWEQIWPSILKRIKN